MVFPVKLNEPEPEVDQLGFVLLPTAGRLMVPDKFTFGTGQVAILDPALMVGGVWNEIVTLLLTGLHEPVFDVVNNMDVLPLEI